jgi:starvation-inducible DNA-binding protein
MDLTESLKKVLANTFGMYLQAHNYHWNVEGMFFSQLHAFFGDLYGQLFAAVDPIAEHIRALGAYAPASMSRYLELMSVEDETSVPSARDMITKLVAANDLVRASLYDAHHAAEAANENGVINFLEDRIDAHDKISWLLKAHLKQI